MRGAIATNITTYLNLYFQSKSDVPPSIIWFRLNSGVHFTPPFMKQESTSPHPSSQRRSKVQLPSLSTHAPLLLKCADFDSEPLKG